MCVDVPGPASGTRLGRGQGCSGTFTASTWTASRGPPSRCSATRRPRGVRADTGSRRPPIRVYDGFLLLTGASLTLEVPALPGCCRAFLRGVGGSSSLVDRQEVSVSNERNGTAPLLMLFSFVHFCECEGTPCVVLAKSEGLCSCCR